MNSTRRLLWSVPFVLLACGGTAASTGPSGESGEAEVPASPSEATTPRAPTTTNPGSTITFEVGEVVATRTPTHAACDEANVPFAAADAFTLQPVAVARSSKVRSIAINFRGTVATNAPLSLVGGPGGGVIFDGARQAHSPDLKTGVDLVVFGPAPDQGDDRAPLMSPLEQATVTMLDVPAKDGDSITARVELRFADGGVLDATFSAPVVSYEGACARP